MQCWAGSRVASILVACAMGGPVSAQPVYRCGPDGRSYSQQPCDDGRPVRTDDARSEAQRHDTTRAADRDARASRRLERERLGATPAPSAPVRIDGRPDRAADLRSTKPAASKARHKRHAEDDDFRAAVPGHAKVKAKAKKAAKSSEAAQPVQ